MKPEVRGLIKDIAVLIAIAVAIGVCESLCRGDEPLIQWPTTPSGNQSIIRVEPGEPKPVNTLKSDEWLVVESSVEIFVRRFPEDVIDVESTTGPIRVRGKFAGGSGRIETREYRTAYVYFLTAARGGVVGVDLIPVGVSAETDIARHVLTVVDGTNPNPPPDPGPGPKPDPKPEPKPEPPKPVVSTVSIAIVEDTMNRSPETAIVMNQFVAWTEFVDSGNDWRAYDVSTKERRGKQAIAVLGDVCPGIVISNKATGAVLSYGKLPDTIDELKALIRRVSGG